MAPARHANRLLGSLVAMLLGWTVLSIVWAPAYMVDTSPLPVDTDPGSSGLVFEDANITSEGLTLEGWWIPASLPRAELIFVHGAGSNRTSQYIGSLDFYRTLNELGISVLTMDLRNHGNSPVSDGMLHMGAAEWPDVTAAANWLDQHHHSNLPRIVLGASMGGSTAIHAIASGLAVDAVILLDPLLDVFDSMKHAGQVVTGIPAPLFTLAAHAAILKYQLPHGERGPLKMGIELEVPILLMQDWDDPVTRSHFAAELAASNPHVTLKKVPEIHIDAPCLDGKEEWGSHVAAHPCHPDWTRGTIAEFVDTLLTSH